MRCRDSEAHALGKLRARGWASPRTRFVNPRGKTRTRHILHVPEEQSTHQDSRICLALRTPAFAPAPAAQALDLLFFGDSGIRRCAEKNMAPIPENDSEALETRACSLIMHHSKLDGDAAPPMLLLACHCAALKSLKFLDASHRISKNTHRPPSE